jgi:hypothetical protein
MSIEVKYDLKLDEDHWISSGVSAEIYKSNNGKYGYKVFFNRNIVEYEDECDALNILKGHPNIVKIFDAVILDKK